MKTHYLKTIQPYFDSCWEGRKLFEVRLNDRDFKVGDEIYLQEYNQVLKTYYGREVRGEITYVLENYYAVESGYVVFAYKITQLITKTPAAI